MSALRTVLLVFVALLFGNLLGDMTTIRDCATKGRAVMRGGGSIACFVEAK